MADKIEEEERRNVAQAEVTEALQGDTLETEFVKLEAGGDGSPDVEAKLAALKQNMGLLPAESTAEPKQLGAGEANEEQAEASKNPGVQDAEVEEVPEDEAESIPEAQLLEEFDRLGERKSN